MRVVDHQLSYHFDLLALQGIYARKFPLRPASVRRHLRNYAGLIHFRGLAEYRLRFIFQNLLRQCRVKSQADVEVVAARELQFAIRGLPDRGLAVCPFTRVFHEVKKSDNGNDVPFAKIGQRGGRLRVVATFQTLWNLTLQRREIRSTQERRGRRGRAWHLVLQEIQVRVVFVGRIGAPRWKLGVARLRGQTCRIAAGDCLLFGSHFGQVMCTVSVQAGGNAEQENQADQPNGFLHGSSSKASEGRCTQGGCISQRYVSLSELYVKVFTVADSLHISSDDAGEFVSGTGGESGVSLIFSA